MLVLGQPPKHKLPSNLYCQVLVMLPDAQLKWRCRRGTKELDYLLQAYLEQTFHTADIVEQQTFVEFLNLQDDMLIQYLLGDQMPESSNMATLVKKIRKNPTI